MVVRNIGEREATVSVGVMTNNQFSWSGRLLPGERVTRSAHFSDNSFEINCRDIAGEHDHQGGYVTNGMPKSVTITINGCADVSVDVS